MFSGWQVLWTHKVSFKVALLNKRGGWINITSLSWKHKIIYLFNLVLLSNIFHWYTQSCVFNKLLSSAKAEAFPQLLIKNKEALSAKRLTSGKSPCRKSLIYGKNKSPNIELALHKKWSFPLRISSVNVTKSEGIYGFAHIYWKNF